MSRNKQGALRSVARDGAGYAYRAELRVTDEAVHLTPESLEDYFRLGAVSVFPLSDSKDARLEIDPLTQELRLSVPAAGGIPDVTGFERIQVERLDGPGATSRFCLTFDASRMHFAAYQLMESIVGYMRDGSMFRQAVGEAIAELRDLLANRDQLTAEQETGLWGELLLVDHLIERVGEEFAVESWLGPTESEHDFSFNGFEAEVKTTRLEARRHHIGSEYQLEPSPDRPLFLLSIQVTLAGAAQNSRTLPQLVTDVRAKLKKCNDRFDEGLDAVHFYDADADLYRTGFQLRSAPRAFKVDDGFPALTRKRLESVVPGMPLISDVRYVINLDSVPFTAPPLPLEQFCEVPE